MEVLSTDYRTIIVRRPGRTEKPPALNKREAWRPGVPNQLREHRRLGDPPSHICFSIFFFSVRTNWHWLLCTQWDLQEDRPPAQPPLTSQLLPAGTASIPRPSHSAKCSYPAARSTWPWVSPPESALETSAPRYWDPRTTFEVIAEV